MFIQILIKSNLWFLIKNIYGKAYMEVKNSNLNKYLLDDDNSLIVNQKNLKKQNLT